MSVRAIGWAMVPLSSLAMIEGEMDAGGPAALGYDRFLECHNWGERVFRESSFRRSAVSDRLGRGFRDQV